ncbi:hypothetical protein FHR75_003937 [Kineococcus radiotolerans]|uniref:Uncharacterized protein n=1 Tax=Kineococcus radiotolerans TaxID=131568 RepID=A0A7W4TQ75_KINRA|nr:hypothetical protein [Kineococcus radiotolerans]MBB2903095.1 hypothetical protein [Kineococcus radiotolerans]
MWRKRSEHVDLSADTALTTMLIARPLDWRVRIVEHIEVDTATSCHRRRSLQAAPLRTLLPESTMRAAAGAKTALVLLNVASVPRGALLDLDLVGPDDAAAFLLPRGEIARREGDYLETLAHDAGLPIDGRLRALLDAMLSYTSTGWKLGTTQELSANAHGYLQDGFGKPLPEQTVSRWLGLDKQIAAVLSPFAESGPDLSPTEHPLLALPFLFGAAETPSDRQLDDVNQVLQNYLQLITTASRLEGSRGATAHELLNALADYGRNYDMLVATTVPLDEPFMIKYSERRDLSFSDWHNEAQQDLVISDALSNHVVLAVHDPNIRITHPRATTAGTDSPAFGAFTTRRTSQIHAVYAHDRDRDYKITLHFRLAPLRRLQYVVYLVAALLLLLAIAVAFEAPHELSDLALIVGPSALAASALLNREPSTLGSHLRRRSTTVLSIALLLLLLVGALSYLWPYLMTDLWSHLRPRP